MRFRLQDSLHFCLDLRCHDPIGVESRNQASTRPVRLTLKAPPTRPRGAQRDSEYVSIRIYWQGGCIGQHEVVRPVRSYQQLRDLDKLMDRIAALRDEGHTTAQLADALNREGFSPPKRRRGFFNDSSASSWCVAA
jgi:hypothetical protein